MQTGGDGRRTGRDPVHAFVQPLVMFDTPSALLAVSSASITAVAGGSMSVVAQGDMQQTAAHTMTQASGATASVYAHQGGAAVIAAHGPVSLRAHTDALNVLADQSVTIISVNHEIRVGAHQQIELVAGQSSITLKGGDIVFMTPGAFTVHGATHAFEAGQFRAIDPSTGDPVAALPHRITMADGSSVSGRTDEKADATHQHARPAEPEALLDSRRRPGKCG